MSSIKLPNVEILAEYTSHLHFIIASKIFIKIMQAAWFTLVTHQQKERGLVF